MNDTIYYDGTKLLSLMDINGKQPEIYICTANRTAGKTTYFGRLLVRKFVNFGEKFCLVYRYSYELDDVATTFFKDIQKLFFRGKMMYSEKRAKGTYQELFLTDETDEECKLGESCGYAICLNTADNIKKRSHLFSDVKRMLFDEFQSETNHYCAGEVQKLISVHTSIARGNGEMVRYVPLYMLSNTVSLINPYYTTLGVIKRLRSDTKFLRGDGYVLEQGFVEAASEAQLNSAFNRAFSSSAYVAYSSQNIYLNDNSAFIENPPDSRGEYMCTLRYDNVSYAVRIYRKEGIIYCDDRIDKTFPARFAINTNDHDVQYVLLRNNGILLQNLRRYFEMGAFRFRNHNAKYAIIDALQYN